MPSPYTYNILRPQGGGNEIGSQYTDLDQDVIGDAINTFMGSYQGRKDRRKQDRLEQQKQALMIAEMQGEVTPELEEAIMGPLQPDTTRGDQALGGLRRLLGSDTTLGQEQPFERSGLGSLKTKYERDLEKESRKAGTEYNKFLRELYKTQFGADVETQQLSNEVKSGLRNEPLSVKDRENLAKIKSKRYGNLSAPDRLKEDLYTGRKKFEDLDKTDFLVLGKFWSSMTPEARSQEALEYAENLVVAQQKGVAKKKTPEEINALVDRYARDFIEKQDQLMSEMKGTQSNSSGDRIPMDDIWNQQ